MLLVVYGVSECVMWDIRYAFQYDFNIELETRSILLFWQNSLLNILAQLVSTKFQWIIKKDRIS